MHRLVTIPLSHYCERARWALDHCTVPYVEEQHLQGFSGRATKRLGARRFAPVLLTDDGVLLKDSADIVAWADARAAADRRLYPDDPAARAEIASFEHGLAAKFGVETRRIAYHLLLPHRALLLKYNAGRAPLHQRVALRLVFPWLARKLRDYLKIGPDEVAAGERVVADTLDAVADRLRDRPWLSGERFGAADLTFASLFAILIWPPEYGMPVPPLGELPDAVRARAEAWRAHPAGRHALATYAACRRPIPRRPDLR